MGTITLTLPTAGTGVTAGLHAANYAALQALLNGNIDAANILDGSITGAKLAAGATGPGDPVTTLPASPVDKQQALLVDSLTAPTYAWLFQYESGISDAYKWVFLGGSPAISVVETSESRNSTSYGDTATVHSLTLPAIKGIFEFHYGMNGSIDTAVNNSQVMSPKFSASEAADADSISVRNGNVSSGGVFGVSMRKRFTVAAASQVITMRYKQGTASAASPVEKRWLNIIPVRVST